ncbi:hypothetical protein D3C87_1651860 [compost metagenome]
MTLITPPMASEPYSEDIGPRTTSMRSIASSGGSQPCSMPALSLFGRVPRVSTRLPSTRIKVYLEDMPRMLISLLLPPPVTTTPGTSFNASVISR